MMISGPADDANKGHADRAHDASPTELDLTRAVIHHLNERRGVQGWTMVSTIAAGLNAQVPDIQQAIRIGVERGWLRANGDPGNAVCLTELGASKSKSGP